MRTGEVNLENVGAHTAMLYTHIKSIPRLYINDRRTEVVVNRLRIGHVGVNQYLHRFKMSDTPMCMLRNSNKKHFASAFPRAHYGIR